MPGKKGENRGRTERYIYTRKGRSLTVIVCQKAFVQTAQGESRKERCGRGRNHLVTPEGMAQVEVPKEEKREKKLPNQGGQIPVGYWAT